MRYFFEMSERARALVVVAVVGSGGTFFVPTLSLDAMRTHNGMPAGASRSLAVLPLQVQHWAWESGDCHPAALNDAKKFFSSKISHLDHVSTADLTRHFMNLAHRHGFDPLFLMALIHVESRFNPEIVSPKGAVGLMQVMPDTAQYVLDREQVPYEIETLSEQLKDPFLNLSVGVSYLAELRNRYKGESKHFLAAYNAGPGRVDRQLKGLVGQIPQTELYVESIETGFHSFRSLVQTSCSHLKTRPKSQTI